MKLHLRSAAKVNLTLDILSQRPDGYHELASVVHTIGIWDEIDLEVLESGGVSFTCSRADLAGDDNLCVRAVNAWNAASGENVGAKIHLEKRIPTGAGLGGGSGNAAAILLGLNRASASPLSPTTLNQVGAKLGADVPLFLEGGAVLMEGIGDRLTLLSPKPGWLTIIKPEASFPTPAIYRAWDGSGRLSSNATPGLLKIWPEGSLEKIGAALGNDLQFAAQSLSELPDRCNDLLRTCQPLGVQMSGSGSACFAIFSDEQVARAAAEAIGAELAKDVQLQYSQLFVAPFCDFGVEVAP